MTAKILEMPKSTVQYWGDLFQGRKPEPPKYNQREFDDLFNGFQNQIDRRQAELYRQAQEIVNLDDLGIQFGVYEPDWRDAEPISDSLTAMEREKGLKK